MCQTFQPIAMLWKNLKKIIKVFDAHKINIGYRNTKFLMSVTHWYKSRKWLWAGKAHGQIVGSNIVADSSDLMQSWMVDFINCEEFEL